MKENGLASADILRRMKARRTEGGDRAESDFLALPRNRDVYRERLADGIYVLVHGGWI